MKIFLYQKFMMIGKFLIFNTLQSLHYLKNVVFKLNNS